MGAQMVCRTPINWAHTIHKQLVNRVWQSIVDNCGRFVGLFEKQKAKGAVKGLRGTPTMADAAFLLLW